jgi:hypothetical protein
MLITERTNNFILENQTFKQCQFNLLAKNIFKKYYEKLSNANYAFQPHRFLLEYCNYLSCISEFEDILKFCRYLATHKLGFEAHSRLAIYNTWNHNKSSMETKSQEH